MHALTLTAFYLGAAMAMDILGKFSLSPDIKFNDDPSHNVGCRPLTNVIHASQIRYRYQFVPTLVRINLIPLI